LRAAWRIFLSGVVKVSLVDVGRWIRENVGASIEPLKEKARKLIKNLGE